MIDFHLHYVEQEDQETSDQAHAAHNFLMRLVSDIESLP